MKSFDHKTHFFRAKLKKKSINIHKIQNTQKIIFEFKTKYSKKNLNCNKSFYKNKFF